MKNLHLHANHFFLEINLFLGDKKMRAVKIGCVLFLWHSYYECQKRILYSRYTQCLLLLVEYFILISLPLCRYCCCNTGDFYSAPRIYIMQYLNPWHNLVNVCGNFQLYVPFCNKVLWAFYKLKKNYQWAQQKKCTEI